MKTADEIQDEIENILAFLYLCEEKPHAQAVRAKEVDGAIPLIGINNSKTFVGVLANDGAPAIWPLRVCTAVKVDGENKRGHKPWPKGTEQLQQIA